MLMKWFLEQLLNQTVESGDITFLPPDKHTQIKKGVELVKIYIKDKKELLITHIGERH